LWWCCGKTEKDASGCKFSKHETKEEDEDEVDPDDKIQNELNKLKNIRCHCCKEIGHRIENCPRDPNIKTSKDPEEDIDRIQKIRDFRKFFSDTMIMTTNFFKKLVKVPKIKQKLLLLNEVEK